MYTNNFSALLSGYQWSGTNLTYSFMTRVPNYYSWNAAERYNFSSFNNTQIYGARRALQLYSEISGLRFTEVSDIYTGGVIRFGTATLSSAEAAHAYYPHPNIGEMAGDVWLNNLSPENFTQTNGSFGFETLVHEIGHALGLEHPGNYNAGGGGTNAPYLAPESDNHKYTIMSYNKHPGSGVYPQTPMLFDIAAIQSLYGANYNTRSGNNTYSWDASKAFVQTIWDGGGIDTISASNQWLPATINLNAGTFSSIGSYSNGSNTIATENLAIAYDVTIENASGSSSYDTIIGNSTNNSLDGNAGNDTLFGNNGNDGLYGESGHDFLDGGSGNDTLFGGTGSDTLLGDNGNDRLVGFSSSSGTEYDVLTGGWGYDTFVLGDAFDVFYEGNGYATLTDFNQFYDKIKLNGSSDDYSLQVANFTGFGSSAQDTAIRYGGDLIGVIQDTSNLSLNSSYFTYEELTWWSL